MNSPRGGKRGDIGGWSRAAARRNTAFLRTIDERKLSGFGVAITLTVRDCPPTSDDWGRARAAFLARMRRAGVLRVHWVTEWQRRGVPHLHGAIWLPEKYDLAMPLEAWCEVASVYGAQMRGQHARVIDGPIGWFQYLSKHAARGVQHYQRHVDNVPESWQEKTGRVWGYTGDWPLAEPFELALEDQHGDGGYFAFRRLVRSWRVAQARSAGDVQRQLWARSMLKCPDVVRSRIRPVSEWINQHDALSLLGNLASRGYMVTQREKKPCNSDTKVSS